MGKGKGMKKLFLGFLFFAGAASAALPSNKPSKQTLDIGKATSSVEFLAIGKPSMLKIRGKAVKEGDATPLQGKLTLEGQDLKGSAQFDLNTLATGISLRDRHMKEKYLETGKFKNAEFELTEMKLPDSVAKGEGEAKDVPFKGKLTVHGVATEVSGKAQVKRTKGKVDLNFAFGTKIPDHKIELPSFMGVKVAEDVEVTVSIEGPLT
jgi:polyisoprenoid-binding protein YceI